MYTAASEISTRSLHDALPIWRSGPVSSCRKLSSEEPASASSNAFCVAGRRVGSGAVGTRAASATRLTNACSSPSTTGLYMEGKRSEEHTSELQPPYDLVCRLL